MTSPSPHVFETRDAFDFYERIRSRLPKASAPSVHLEPKRASNLEEIASLFDVFVFDAYGVLNRGRTALPGVAPCLSRLRRAGKRLFVLTNAASLGREDLPAKFARLGFDFSPDEIISSRHAAEQAMISIHRQASNDALRWGVIASRDHDPESLPYPARILGDDPALYDQVDAVVFLSTQEWNEQRQDWLCRSLRNTPRPVIIANPDVVAPVESGLSMEPGYYAHRLMDETEAPIEFHGKPFPSVYEIVKARLDSRDDPTRIAMLGDTLHTDILGALSQGWSSLLVDGAGLFRGHDVVPFIECSQIYPDWIIPHVASAEH